MDMGESGIAGEGIEGDYPGFRVRGREKAHEYRRAFATDFYKEAPSAAEFSNHKPSDRYWSRRSSASITRKWTEVAKEV